MAAWPGGLAGPVFPDRHGQQGGHQVGGTAQHPRGALGGHPPDLGQAGRRRARRLGIGPGPGRQAGAREQVVEPAGDEPVPALAGVQPVHGPHPRVVDLGVPGRVVVQRAEPGRQAVGDRVHLARPPGQRPGQGAGQAEHLARVRQPHGQHLGARGAQRTHRVGQGRGHHGRVETGPQRVVDPDDDAGDLGPQLQGRGELIALQVAGARPAGGQDVQPRLAQAPGEQRGPAPPGPAARPCGPGRRRRG